MKKLLVNALMIQMLTVAGVGYSVDLEVSTAMNEPRISYELQMKNPARNEILCESIRITLSVGKNGCTENVRPLVDTWTNIRVKAAGKVIDTNYGLEVLDQLKDKDNEFCGDPQFTFDCKYLPTKGQKI